MNCEIHTIPPFDKQLKRLVKKYPSLKNDLFKLTVLLTENPKSGVFLGNGCYKIRLSIESKGKGKSGGVRIITYFYYSENKLFLLSIYDKSEIPDITDKEIKSLLNNII